MRSMNVGLVPVDRQQSHNHARRGRELAGKREEAAGGSRGGRVADGAKRGRVADGAKRGRVADGAKRGRVADVKEARWQRLRGEAG
jgi:hypothetical protein